jgi:hypothetical protein
VAPLPGSEDDGADAVRVEIDFTGGEEDAPMAETVEEPVVCAVSPVSVGMR